MLLCHGNKKQHCTCGWMQPLPNAAQDGSSSSSLARTGDQMGSFCMEKRQPSFTKQQKSQTISQKCWGFILETFLLACRGRTASLRGKATPLPSSSVRFQAGFNSGLAQRFPPGRCWGGGGERLSCDLRGGMETRLGRDQAQ